MHSAHVHGPDHDDFGKQAVTLIGSCDAPKIATSPKGLEHQMFTRTKKRTVHFNAPFTLIGLQGVYPAGHYDVLDDEEQITGLSWLAYRRVSTMIEVASGNKKSLIDIDPSELDAALEKDKLLAVSEQ